MSEPEVDLQARAQTRVGATLKGKYRIDRVLGVGGMASVYAATHRNQAEFAVKMLHPELSIREDIRMRFLREGYVANSVKHPGAVLVVDDDVAEDGSAFLVMELLQGAPVEELWEKHGRRLPPKAAAAIGHQLLDVLAAAHGKTIVHRDIKPANVFVTREGVVKVLDFGIARLRDAMGSSHATQTGMMMGTPAFMAPEQAMAKSSEIDGQTDLWAVGAMLFTLVSGHLVHEGDNAQQLLIRAATAQARPLSSVAPDVPAAIARVIDTALAFEKSARWPGAAAMRDALRDAYSQTFGESISREAVTAFFQEAAASTERPAPAAGIAGPSESGPVRIVVSTPGVPIDVTPHEATRMSPAGPIPMAPGRTVPVMAASALTPQPVQLPGLTTAKPVSSDPAGMPRKGKRGLLVAGIAGGVVVVALGVGAAVKLGGGGERAPASVRDTATVTATATADPAAAVTLAPPANTAPTTTAATATPTATATAAPTTTAKAGPMAKPAATAAAPPSAKPATTATGKPNCNPNYYFDSEGNKHFKPECF